VAGLHRSRFFFCFPFLCPGKVLGSRPFPKRCGFSTILRGYKKDLSLLVCRIPVQGTGSVGIYPIPIIGSQNPTEPLFLSSPRCNPQLLHPSTHIQVTTMSDTTTTRSVVSRSSSMSSDELMSLTGRERIDRIIELYAAGKPLFSRAILEDLVRQLERRPESVYITTFVEDREKMYSLKSKWWDSE
jgi:hypothetical protein